MARTTIHLKESLEKKLSLLAESENRSIPNLIETILLRYLEDEVFADEFEMELTRRDKSLKKSILSGLRDYRNQRGKYA